MKKLFMVLPLVFLLCFTFVTSVVGQETFKLPELTVEQKYKSMVRMFWGNIAPGIRFAKSYNVSPYEYGKFYGKLFAQYWNKEVGFKGYVQGVLRNWSFFITDTDSKIIIEKESDNMLIFKVPPSAFFNYFGKEGRHGVSAEEMLQMINGSHEQIAGYLGCTSNMVLEGEWIIVTVKEK